MKLPIIFSFLALSSLTAADWPHFLGPTRDGFSTETNLLKSFPKEGPELLWEAKLEEGFGGAAVMGDEVFIVDRVSKEKDILRCLSLKDGKEQWNYESPSEGEPPFPGSRSVPTVEEDAVYFIGPFGEVFRINRETHKPDWKISLKRRYPDADTPKWGYAQCVLVVGDVVIVTPFGEDIGIVGWDKKTGKELWKSDGFGNTHSSPTIMNLCGEEQIVILTTDGTGLTSFEPKTGKKLWQSDLYQNRIPITVPVQVGQDRIFASGGYDGGSKMLSVKKQGSEYKIETLWEIKKGTQVHPPLLIENHLYFLANENSNHKVKAKRKTGGLACYTLEGKELWNTGDEPFMGRGNSIFVDGMIIIQDGESGVLRLVDPDPSGFKLLAESNVFETNLDKRRDLKYWSNMALSNGHLLMRGQNRLLCLKMSK